MTNQDQILFQTSPRGQIVVNSSQIKISQHVGTCSLCYGDVHVQLNGEFGAIPICSQCGAVAKYKMPLMVMELKREDE